MIDTLLLYPKLLKRNVMLFYTPSQILANRQITIVLCHNCITLSIVEIRFYFMAQSVIPSGRDKKRRRK